MLPKDQRLTSNRIEYLFKKGRKIGNSFLVVRHMSNKKDKSRFCIIVSTKIFAKAVQRNLLRRQIYEIIRNNPQLPSTPSDIAVIVKIPLTKLNFRDLTKTILQTLQNLKSNS